MMLKWNKKKSKVFLPSQHIENSQDQGPNCLILRSLILHCLLTQGLFSPSAQNPTLNYRAGYEIATLSSLLRLFSLK